MRRKMVLTLMPKHKKPEKKPQKHDCSPHKLQSFVLSFFASGTTIVRALNYIMKLLFCVSIKQNFKKVFSPHRAFFVKYLYLKALHL